MVVIPEDQYRDQDPTLIHYGTPRHSGRYPYGSGDQEATGATQRNTTLLAEVDRLKRELNIDDTKAASLLGVTTTQLRSIRTNVRNTRKQDEIAMAKKLKEKGMSNVAIAKRMRESGYSVKGESQVRNLLKEEQEKKAKVLDDVTDTLRAAVDKKKYLDVGSGVEFQLKISSTKLRSAIQALKDEGYTDHQIKIDQLTTGKQTNMRILAGPGVEWSEVMKNRTEIQQLQAFSDDGGLSVLALAPPKSISSKRVGIRYAKDGGTAADGTIYIRPGVKDVELGKSRYAQVRVMVDGTHYLKGMAIYKDDLPAGVDLMFNTNKDDTGNKLDAMKKLKRLRAEGDDPTKPEKFTGPVDMDNPFGASIKRQIGPIEPGKTKTIKPSSVMNIVNEEGDWNLWSKNLPSQFLSKQRPPLAKEQLAKTYSDRRAEYENIMALDNPSVKKKLLEAFTDGTDSAAVHLKAASLPRQKTQVILPVESLKDNEIYAPNFKPGERVALVRFPHGGTFEIPELVVSHKNPDARRMLGDAKDAVGINSKVAERLSGADFDGDTVMVIPNHLKKVRSSPALEGLEGFDAKRQYPHYEGMKVMSDYEKGIEMGRVSNLITDMTIGGATNDELARAVRHSMVVIDAEKHKLDYKRSEKDNGIAALAKRYQGGRARGGTTTLISKANSRTYVDERKERSAKDGGPIDPKTGKKVYTPTGKGRKFIDDKGVERFIPNRMESTKLAETDDAHTLSSGTVIEKLYGDHSNKLKALANEGRKELVKIKPRAYDPAARQTYRAEYDSLVSKINVAIKNAPLERQAQVLANATLRMRIQANPELRNKDNVAELKRTKSQALTAARLRTGASKEKFDVTDAEWKAIQAGAITAHKLDQVLTYADLDRVKELATPRDRQAMNPGSVARAKAYHARGYSWAEIAEVLGVSVSTVQREVTGEEGGD